MLGANTHKGITSNAQQNADHHRAASAERSER